MRILIVAMLCAFSMGCTENRRPATSAETKTSPPTTVTVNRPVIPEVPATENEPLDRANTGVNVRDRNDATKTPLDQSENDADVKITAEVRKKVIATKMSSNGHNVKIITQDGKVTLRGPVPTDLEKQQIENIAISVAGNGNVDSQLEVNRN